MTHKKEVVFSLLFVIMVLCTGCSDKDNGDTSKNNRTSRESFVQEETIENTDNIDNAGRQLGTNARTENAPNEKGIGRCAWYSE